MSEESPPQTATEERTVPHETFRRVAEAKQGLEAQLEEARSQIATLTEKAATVDTLAQQLSDKDAAMSGQASAFERFKTIAQATGSMDSDVIDMVGFAHSRLPEEGRPELGDWLSGMKENPDSAPALLRGLFTEAPPPKPKAQPAKSAPDQAPSRFSPEQVAQMRQKAIRTGDWTEYEQYRGGGLNKGS